jgi:hypothetical protein
MPQKVWAQHLRDGEHPLCVTDRFEHILAQPVRRLGRALRSARGAKPPALAREGHEHVLAAVSAADAGEAILENAAIEIALDDSVDASPPEPETRLETLLPFPFDRLEPCLEKAIERRGLRLTRPINGWAGSGRARAGGLHAPRPKRLGVLTPALGPIPPARLRESLRSFCADVRQRSLRWTTQSAVKLSCLADGHCQMSCYEGWLRWPTGCGPGYTPRGNRSETAQFPAADPRATREGARLYFSSGC